MTWIKTVEDEDAQGRLKVLYDRIRSPDGQIDNIMKAHSLRPHTMDGHMALYKNVLHHSANKLPKWFLEAIGVYVSMLNRCSYCVEHHFIGMKNLLCDDDRCQSIRSALETDDPASAFAGAELAALTYARMLTREPSAITPQAIENARSAGLEDGEILEVNQVSAYFAYANRTVLGLGINPEGEKLGLAPGDTDDSGNWTHA